MSNRVFKLLLIDDEESIHEAFEKVFENELNHSNEDKGDFEDFFDNTKGEIGFTNQNKKISMVHAHHGEEGLALFMEALERGDPYDLVICDIRMPPGIDGKETLMKISEVADHTILLVCSAYSDYPMGTITESVKNNPFLGMINKPFISEDLREIVLGKLDIIEHLGK